MHVGFSLKRIPAKPRYVPFISLTKFISGVRNETWRDYLPVFEERTHAYGRDESAFAAAAAG